MLLVSAPEHLPQLLEPLPDGVVLTSDADPLEATDVVLLFVTDAADLRSRFRAASATMQPDGGLWVAYPKRSSGVPTDVTFPVVQRIGLDAGLVDNKSCAIDATWSAVRFVVRLADRHSRR